MKALIVDGEELFRLSLREVISVASNFHEILEAGSEHEFMTRAASHPDLSLVIIHPGSMSENSDTCLKLVKRLYPQAAVVTILSRQDAASPVAGSPAGGVIVPRNASVSQIVTAIRRALKLPLEGYGAVASRPSAPDVRTALQSEAPRFRAPSPVARLAEGNIDFSRLSYRQKQILAMAADGLPNKEIAARLSIAEGTVKAHMHAIFKVLGVSNRTQAVIRYGAAGGIPAPGARASEWAYAAAN